MHILLYAPSDLAYFKFVFHFIAGSAATLLFFVLSGVKVRFCESLGCGRGTPGHLLMGGSVLKKKFAKLHCALLCSKAPGGQTTIDCRSQRWRWRQLSLRRSSAPPELRSVSGWMTLERERDVGGGRSRPAPIDQVVQASAPHPL